MYSVNTTPSQNVQPAKEQHYTKEQLKEDLKKRDAKSKPYSARPGETAWGFEKEQMNNQGMSTATKKRGIRGLFSRDHAKGAEKEARKEMIHAEKAERFAQRSRDPALTDRERRKFLRKAAKQQASADFHESLKKKHVIGATPGHKYQAVPAMATHHPIVHDNTTNTVRTTVNDQSFAPSRMPVGPAAFDGISEIGSRQALEPHPAVLNVSNNIKPQQRWDGQVARGRKVSRKQPAYISTGDRRAIVTQQRSVQPQYTSSRVFNDNQLMMQGQKLRKVQTIEKGGLSSFGDEWAKRKQWQAKKNVSFQPQQREFVVYASKPALQRKATGLKPTQTKQKQGSWLQQKDLRTKAQSLRKAQTVEKGGVSSYTEEFIKSRQQRSVQQQPIQQQRQALPFGAADLQGVNLRSRQQPIQQQRQALPFGAADLQGINLRSRQQPIQQQPDYLVGYYDDDMSDDDEEDDIDGQSREIDMSVAQKQALPFGASELQQGAKGLNESQPWKSRKLPFSGAYLREGARRLQHASTSERNGMWLNAGHLSSQSKKLNHVTPRVRDSFMISGPALRSKREALNRTKTIEKRAITLPSIKVITAQRKNLKSASTRERSSFFIPAAGHLRNTRAKLNKVGNPSIINTVVVSDDLQVPKNTKQARAINFSKIGQAKAAQQPTLLASIGNFVTGLFSSGVESQ